MAAVPERSHIAATRSGCRVLMTSDQIPPPEWPHKTQGTLLISGWRVRAAKSSKAWRNVFSEPRLGSNHSCDPPGESSVLSFKTWYDGLSRAQSHFLHKACQCK